MKKFSWIQRIRNKIRTKGNYEVSIEEGARLINCTIYIKGNNNRLIIGQNSVLRHTRIEILGDNCSIIIGKDCGIGHYSYLSAKEAATLTIKNGCSLSRNVKIMTSDGHPVYQHNKLINLGRDITLENHVWITDNVTILKGVNIGTSSIVGINSTLTKSIPAHSIAVGNPAKVVKEHITWEL